MPCGWEGNYRSGIALAICRRLKWFIHLLWAKGLRKGYEHSPSLFKLLWHSLPFFCDKLQCFDAVGWAAVRASGL